MSPLYRYFHALIVVIMLQICVAIVLEGVFEIVGIPRCGTDRWVHLVASLVMSTAITAVIYEEASIRFI